MCGGWGLCAGALCGLQLGFGCQVILHLVSLLDSSCQVKLASENAAFHYGYVTR